VIVGLGMDLVDIPRIRAMLARFGDRAAARVWTPGERAYCAQHADPAVPFAARFAAKEACFKALSGSPEARAIGWHEMEVVRDFDGAPTLVLHGRAAARASALGVTGVHVTLTHAESVAGAVVVLERVGVGVSSQQGGVGS
jgi:holo-[acyl-carrier protein] synthase